MKENLASNTSKYSEHIESDLIKKLTKKKKTFINIEEPEKIIKII